jgi:hypothetical protein
MATVTVRVGYVHEVWGEVTASGDTLTIRPATPADDLAIQRIIQTMRRPQDGTAEQFVAGMPERLRALVWAEVIEDRNGD